MVLATNDVNVLKQQLEKAEKAHDKASNALQLDKAENAKLSS